MQEYFHTGRVRFSLSPFTYPQDIEEALAGHQVNQPLLSFALLAGKINILL
jgi:hypothetical protein